ncbi:MAG: sigma-70 family RNA polymerase sigma factor [Sedimentisphaerales bacterium]|nr:sigma-70 family RNA polymerase sigma factor [Sedimentisphaerales bacterium]
MDTNKDYAELIRQARLGSRESLDILAQRVRGRLYAYVYRIMLREDISQDIVQESMLEMFNNLDKLEQADRFWPWLCKIAFYKIRHYYHQEHRYKTVSMSDAGDWPQDELRDEQTGVTALIGEELKQLVFDAMRELKPKHRAVLAMRCYEDMQYSQIAQLMGSSELRTRVLFYRAKEALQKHFAKKGFGKGFLLSALALFGKMTAPSEAAVPSVTVTAAATKVGAAAAIVGVATSKTTVATLAAAAAIAAGTILTPLPVDKAVAWTNKTADAVRQKINDLNAAANVSAAREEYWYYYPEKAGGPVIKRFIRQHPQTKQSYCHVLEDDHANYYLDKQTNILHINNYRMWQDNLAVARLPADSPNLTKFLSSVEGRNQNEKMAHPEGMEHPVGIDYVSSEQDGLLVVVNCGEAGTESHISHNYNVLDEEYFRYNRPLVAAVVDNRDAMHKRGWTYFRITGHINGEEVSGTGRLPFVYAAYRQSSPWLRLNVANRLEITDSVTGAGVYNADRHTFNAYTPETFFRGLARPWMGLHTIDTIRREAAELQLPFETKYTPEDSKAEVVLTHKQNKIVYTVDMQKDLIEKILILIKTDKGLETKAELIFSYLDDVTNAGAEFAGPKEIDYRKPQQHGPGTLWLLRLVEGALN